jgi:hypothetical protein
VESSGEQQVAIKFCFKVGKTVTEIVQMVYAAFGDEALVWSNIFCWYGWFCEGQEGVQNDPRSGCPSESQTDGNIENVQQLLPQNHHLLLRMMVDKLDISKDTIRKTVVEGLKKRKVCSLFVLHAR